MRTYCSLHFYLNVNAIATMALPNSNNVSIKIKKDLHSALKTTRQVN